MTKLKLIVLAILCSATASSQDYLGYRTGNFTGVNAVFTNPANIADNQYYLDVNLLTVSTLAANNRAFYKLKNFSETFKSENLREKLFGDNVGPASGMFNIDIHGPSAMFTIGKTNKSAIAFTTRARMFANVVEFDSRLFNQLTKPNGNDPLLPITLRSLQNQQFSVNGWTEYGASFSHVLMNKGSHVIKGGVSLKYLAGAVNGFVNVQNLTTTIRADQIVKMPYLENTSGNISAGFSGTKVSGFEGKELFKNNGYGFGTDIGFVYEYRPDEEMQTTNGLRLKNNYKKLYKFKFAAALLDLGSILYKRDAARSGNYALNIDGVERLYLEQLKDKDVDDFNQFFKDNPQYFIPINNVEKEEYSVSLPTTLQLEADYLINDGFYIHLAGQLSLSDNSEKYYNNKNYSAVTLTPRYEDKIWGVYLPINYNYLTHLNAGLSFRVGPFFLGSGSVLSALFSNSKQADVHIGIRVGELR